MTRRKRRGPGKNGIHAKKVKRAVPELTGRVQMTREGFVFVIVDGQEDDVFVKASKTRGALNGDTVRVAVTKPRTEKRKCEGEVVEIVERSQRPFVGILHVTGQQAWVLMSAKTMPYDIEVPVPEGVASGTKVAAVVDRWDRGEPNPSGHIVDILGAPGENETEMHAILAEFGLPYRFDKSVEDAAGQISDRISDRDRKGRRDFRDTLTFTIDPADAKDYDDALSFKVLPSGNYEVGVHIADVTHYVTPGTLLDREAEARGTSVYLVDRTVPMLPEKLSNRLCSLRPHEEKLTFSAVFEVSAQGKVFGRWFGRTLIRSDYRFSYELAQEVIETSDPTVELGAGSECGVVPQAVKEAVWTLNAIALKLRRKRFAAGAIEFDRPEMKVEVDEKGRPVAVHQKISREANWLIEEFMLLANRSVAEYVATAGRLNGKAAKGAKTFVYRVHDVPNAEKVEGLRTFAGNFGYKLGETGSSGAIAKSLNALLTAAKDKPEFAALELLALRSMAKATYSTDNIGHYGLAFPFYTHFTSPIRRYPDMMVHRLLALYLEGGDSQSKDYYSLECKHASEREVVAAEAERESIKYKLVEFMQDKVGAAFEGHVSGLTEWGMYVEVEPTKIEGMVPLRDIRSDFFDFDEEHYLIRGRRSGVVYRLGDPVRIRVKSTNLEQKLLDYELLDPALEAPRAGRPSGDEGKAPKRSGKPAPKPAKTGTKRSRTRRKD